MTVVRASHRLLAIGLLALGLAAVRAPSLSAQGPDGEGAVDLSGVVVDAGSGAAVPGAAVLLTDRSGAVFADRNGRFTLREVQPGTRTLVVAQLGYDSLRTAVEVGEGSPRITLRLTPDPVALGRITALVDRFEARRNAVASSVRAFDQARLRAAETLDVLEFVRSRANVRPIRCPGVLALSPCAYVRGRATEVQVFVDGTRVISGLDVLTTFRPEEIYTLEVIGGGRVIRAYTNWYVETAARGRPIPTEVFF